MWHFMIYLPANYVYVCLAMFIVPPQTVLSSNIVRLKSHCDLRHTQLVLLTQKKYSKQLKQKRFKK